MVLLFYKYISGLIFSAWQNDMSMLDTSPNVNDEWYISEAIISERVIFQDSQNNRAYALAPW